MTVQYSKEIDALYIRLTDAKIEETVEVQPGVLADFDADGELVAIEVLQATRLMEQKSIPQLFPVSRNEKWLLYPTPVYEVFVRETREKLTFSR